MHQTQDIGTRFSFHLLAHISFDNVEHFFRNMSEASEFIGKCTVDDSLTLIDLSVYKARGSLVCAINPSKPGEIRPLKASETSSNYLISPNCLSDTLSL
ncbi:hypothetical protein HZS_4994, partial [Henneguya salminicola]